MKGHLKSFLNAAAVLAVMASGLAIAPASAEPVTLVVSNSQWLDALRGERLWASLKKYEEVNPGVTLEQEAIPSNAYADRLTTEMGAGQGPDIAIVQDGVFYPLAAAGFMIPLDDITEGVDNLNATNKNGVIDGKRLGIGWQRAVYALIYNKKNLEAAGATVPTTVDELIAQAEAVTKATGAIGFTGRYSMNEFSAWWKDFDNWAYGYGVSWVDDAGNFTINTPEAVAAVNAFKAVYDAGIMPIGDQMSTQRTRFKEGQVAFSIDNSGGSLNIASGGTMPSSDMGASALPFTQPGAHQQLFIAVSAHSKHPDEAKAFLKWLISPEGQQSLRDASGPDALATDVPVTDEFKAANPWAPEFAELAKSSRSVLIPGHEADTAAIMRIVMTGVEKVLQGAASAEDALAQAETQVKAKF